MIDWRLLLRSSFTSLDLLAEFLELDDFNRSRLLSGSRFPLLLPRRLAKKIEKNRLDDPILLQFVPLTEESRIVPGFTSDPVCDQAFRKAPKLLHKYKSRALIVSTSACAMHCRYCFRQNFDYESDPTFQEELQALSSDETIEEVILSGGDPLSLPDHRLDSLLQAIAVIPHIRRIRFHTRFLIGIPERINESLLSILKKCSKPILFVVHVNHPREMDEDVQAAIKRIQMLGIPCLNQSVLLKGVNDREEVLLELSRKLLDSGVIPYYLHLLDRVAGTAYFEVEATRGLELISYLQKQMSGFGVPKLAREEPGKSSKTVLHPFNGLQS